MCDVIYKKFNRALFWPIWWSHLHYIVDFFQMYIILMSWMNSSWVFWKLSECKRPTWRQTLLRFSLKIFCLQDQWWSCKCRNFCAISMRLTSKPIGLCALLKKEQKVFLTDCSYLLWKNLPMPWTIFRIWICYQNSNITKISIL